MSNRVLAGASWAVVQDNPALGTVTPFERAAMVAQDEREADFIRLVNALGGMPRTRIIHGLPVQVNGQGDVWHAKRMAESRG